MAMSARSQGSRRTTRPASERPGATGRRPAGASAAMSEAPSAPLRRSRPRACLPAARGSPARSSAACAAHAMRRRRSAAGEEHGLAFGACGIELSEASRRACRASSATSSSAFDCGMLSDGSRVLAIAAAAVVSSAIGPIARRAIAIPASSARPVPSSTPSTSPARHARQMLRRRRSGARTRSTFRHTGSSPLSRRTSARRLDHAIATTVRAIGSGGPSQGRSFGGACDGHASQSEDPQHRVVCVGGDRARRWFDHDALGFAFKACPDRQHGRQLVAGGFDIAVEVRAYAVNGQRAHGDREHTKDHEREERRDRGQPRPDREPVGGGRQARGQPSEQPPRPKREGRSRLP